MESVNTSQVILTVLFALFMYLSHPPEENHVVRGDEFYRSCDNKRALNEYEQAYNKSPRDYASLIRLVRIHNDNGRIHLMKDSLSESEYRKAIIFADSLVQYYPDSAASHFWAALAKGSLIPFVGVREKISIGKVVRQHINNSLERDSTFYYPYIIRAIFEREGSQLSWIEKGLVRLIFGEDLSGSLKMSEFYLQRVLKYDPNNSFAHYELFWTYKAMKDTERAAIALHQVLAINPQSLREKNQQEEARKYLTDYENHN